METIRPNPECLITLLNGDWVVWPPASNSPTRISRAELLALGGVRRTGDESLVAAMLAKGTLGAFGDSVPPRTPLERLSDPGDADLPSGLLGGCRVNHHFAMRPCRDGFIAYSSQRRSHVLLPATVAAALGGPMGEQVASDDEGASPWFRLRDQLVDYGFLVARANSPTVRVAENAAGEFVRYATSSVTKALRNRERDPDLAGRIPVYFAGCIDLATDASYGYLNLALGMIRAAAESYEGGRLRDRYYMVPHFLLTPAAVMAAAQTYGPGVVFFSNYTWAYEGNLRAAKQLKSLDRRFLCVFGGPQAPSYDRDVKVLYDRHPCVDILVRGEGEMTAADLLDKLVWFDRTPDLSTIGEVEGIAYRVEGNGGFHRTEDRPRIMDLSAVPSAYLSGVFDEVPREILYGATLETNRGCPYSCTFCDWGSATRQKVRRFDLDRVREELDWIGRSGIAVLFLADANFGIFARDVEIAQMIVEMANRYGSLKKVIALYAKNGSETLPEIVRMFARSGLASEGIISIQTRDTKTLQVIHRHNIKSEKYDDMLELFRTERLPLSTDLMIGLPGATPESFKTDLQYYFEKGVQAKAYLTRLLVNSPMADPDYMTTHGIETDEKGFLRSCNSYSLADRDYMLDLYGMYYLSVRYGLFKYVLFYLQWDKGIRCVDFIDEFLREITTSPGRYPLSWWALGFLRDQMRSPGGWRPVLEEAAGFAERRYGVSWDGALEAVLQAQEAVLADPDKVANQLYQLEHDVVRYYRDGEQRKPLAEYGPGTLTVRDVYGMCSMDPARHYQFDAYSVSLELDSELNDVDRPVLYLGKDAFLAKLQWPKRAMLEHTL